MKFFVKETRQKVDKIIKRDKVIVAVEKYMASLTTQITKETRDLIEEFGYSREEFIAEAVKEKLMELKKLQFFAISEKIRKGLKKRGLKPEDVLQEIKS